MIPEVTLTRAAACVADLRALAQRPEIERPHHEILSTLLLFEAVTALCSRDRSPAGSPLFEPRFSEWLSQTQELVASLKADESRAQRNPTLLKELSDAIDNWNLSRMDTEQSAIYASVMGL